MILGGTVEYFVDTVFNYPTLAECYKAAAFNGLNKLPGLEMQGPHGAKASESLTSEHVAVGRGGGQSTGRAVCAGYR